MRGAKSFLKSKTFWVNLVGVVILVLQFALDEYVIDPDWQGVGLGILNILIRFKTDKPIYLKR